MAKLVQSSVQFTSVGDEASYFIQHIARPFMGGWSGSGENGIDVSLPLDTPIYAVESGTVVGSGYYGGGGVVSINSGPGKIWYYQHLDQDAMTTGQHVNKGDLVGYSGGQNSGGNHPASPEFSSFEHVEIGLNAPWGGIWGNPSGQGNINPVPALSALAGDSTSVSKSTTGPTSSSSSGASINPLDPSTWVSGIESGVLSGLGISSLQDFLWRAGFILVGGVLILIGFLVAFQHQAEEGIGTVVGAGVKAA